MDIALRGIVVFGFLYVLTRVKADVLAMDPVLGNRMRYYQMLSLSQRIGAEKTDEGRAPWRSYLERLPKRCSNRATRPPVSRIFCLPV